MVRFPLGSVPGQAADDRRLITYQGNKKPGKRSPVNQIYFIT